MKRVRLAAALLSALLGMPAGALAVPLTNGNFEAAPATSGWTLTGAPVVSDALAPNSTQGVRFTATGQALAQTLAGWGADWFIECYFAVRATTSRAFSLGVYGGAAIGLNLRYENGGFATFDGSGWGTNLAALGTLEPSIDADGNGSLEDPGDAKNVYRLRVTGRGWGTAAASYDLALTEANGSVYTRTVTGLTRYQTAAPLSARPALLKFGTENGGNPGFWLDDIATHEDSSPGTTAAIAYFVSSHSHLATAQPVTLSWQTTGADSLRLDPGALNVTGQTSVSVTPAATSTYTLTAEKFGAAPATASFVVGVGGETAPARISEVQSSNGITLSDEDGDEPDWLEIYNPNAHSLNLAGWQLTTGSAISPGDWAFPPLALGPGQYLVVFASDKNRRAAAPFHTDFKLSATGESLALYDDDGVKHDEIVFPALPQDMSYGPPATGGAPVILTSPTPGAANAVAGPLLYDAAFAPQPDGSLRLSVRAQATLSPLASVQAFYRAMYAAEQSLPLTAQPDGTHAATIPTPAAGPGQMIRWRFTAADTGGQSVKLPPYPSPATSPQYFGHVVPDPALTTALPVFHWFLQPGQENAAATRSGARACVSYLGEFYDNVLVHLRGATTASLEKKPYQFEFHRGSRFRFQPDKPRVSQINLNAAYVDSSYLRDVLPMEDMRLAGMPTPETFPVRMQRNGDFHSLAIMVEQVDDDFLARHPGLDEDGPLYKATGNGSWLTGTTGFETRNGSAFADLQTLTSKLTSALATRTPWMFDYTDLPAIVNYLAVNNI